MQPVENPLAPLPADWRTQCSWCGRHLRGEPSAPVVSHGICEECMAKELRVLAEMEGVAA